MVVYATVGISASGKTTWAKKYTASRENIVLIDTDEIRAELWGDAADQRNGAQVFAVAYERMNAALNEGNDVVFCATSTTLRARNALREAIRAKGVRVQFVWFPVRLEVCLERNAKRERKVPENVIRRQYHNMQAFTEEEDYSVGGV